MNGITGVDILRLSPEIALTVAASIIIVADLFARNKVILPILALLGLAVSAGLSLALLGNQGPGFFTLLLIDQYALFFKLFFLGVAALIVLSSIGYARKFAHHQGEYYALLLASTSGMMLMASARELIAIYIALELTSIPLYILAGFLKDAKSTEASLKYLLLGALSSAILLYGMALIFGATGTTDLGQIVQAVRNDGGTLRPLLLLGVIFIVAGFGFKISAVPFNMWAPDVYEGAPTPVTAFLSVGSKAAGFAVILRVFFTFGADFSGAPVLINWPLIWAILAALSMVVGNLVALVQTNVKRMLAYSSIAQAGYMMIGIATPGIGSHAVLFFMLSYAFTNLGAFICIIAISQRINSDEISDFAGMIRRSPFLAIMLTYCLISLTGIPPTAGFFAKFYLFYGGVQGGLVPLVLIAVVASAISAFYYLKIVRAMLLSPAPADAPPVSASPAASLAIVLSVLGVLVLGVYPTLVLDALNLAAKSVSVSLLP